jgi:hypothetical protein
MRRNKTRIINLRTMMEQDITEKGEASPTFTVPMTL